MRLGQDNNGFFVQTVEETYGAPIDFNFMSKKELESIMTRGAKIWDKLNPPQEGSLLKKFVGTLAIAGAVVGAGALAFGSSAIFGGGTAAAAGSGAAKAAAAASAPALQAGAAAAGSQAASSALSVGKIWGAIKTAAPFAAKASGIVGAVTGEKDAAKKAQKVAKIVGESDSAGAAATAIADEFLREKGVELDAEGRAALREIVDRERRRMASEYEQQLRRRMATTQRRPQAAGGTQFPMWALAIPVGAYFLMSS